MKVTKMTTVMYNGGVRILAENKNSERLIKPANKKVSPEDLQKMISKNRLLISNGIKLSTVDYDKLDTKFQSKIDENELRRTNEGEQNMRLARTITIIGLTQTVVGLAGSVYHLVKDQEHRVIAGIAAVGLLAAGIAEGCAINCQSKQIDTLQHDRALLLSRKLNS